MRVKIILCVLLLTSFLFGQERKGFWVVRYALETPEKIDQIMQTAHTAGITDLFVQVRALGETYFHSSIEGKNRRIPENFDPLSYAIEKAGLYDLRIHAWINMFYIWSGNFSPADSMHVFYRLNRAILRNNTFPTYHELRSEGIEGFFLDPQDKQVQNYLLNLLGEIADNYDVSGIHLDYFRYPDITYSFTPASRSNFMVRYWYDPLDVYQPSGSFTKNRGYEVFMEADRQYRIYLNDVMAGFLHRISDRVGQKLKKIELSVAVKPDPVTAKHRYFQDWKRWLEEKLCNFVVVMNYNIDKREFLRVLRQFPNGESRKNIIMGISTYNQRVEDVLDRIDLVREEHFAGYSLFSYNHLIENKGYLAKLMHNNRF